MRASVWRQSPELCEYAAKLFSTPQFRTALAVIRNESPHNFDQPSNGVLGEDRIVWAGRVEGYNQALRVLESLAKPIESAFHLEATFEPPEQPQQ